MYYNWNEKTDEVIFIDCLCDKQAVKAKPPVLVFFYTRSFYTSVAGKNHVIPGL